ncbi:sortase [Candidatus Saccharibacteria bacterium]|nr:sortase [Candidatus Saccharibacteria bacterium]
MDSNNGGLSSAERQRQTAAEIARQKVIAAYQKTSSISGGNPNISRFSARYSNNDDNARPIRPNQFTSNRQNTATSVAQPIYSKQSNTVNAATQSVSAYKQMPVQTQPTTEEFKKYHSAWQGYYQKYYSDYYAKAAKQYIEEENLKRERRLADEARENEALKQVNAEMGGKTGAVAGVYSNTAEPAGFRARIQKLANEEEKHKKKMKKLTPIIAGLATMAVILFLQYNRMIFAPIMAYVSPGNASETTITEVDPTVAVAVKEGTVLLIPKLNIDVPIQLGLDANDTDALNKAMNQGVIQFSIPGANALPGQVGNFVISGHSAGDIYSNNQYKFIFSGLERLNENDLVYVDYNGQRYTYKVTKKDTVLPTDVSALVYTGDKPILTLITCWPLGTSRYRLLVTAEQINPNPDGAEPASEKPVQPSAEAVMLPENDPTLFESIWSWLMGN